MALDFTTMQFFCMAATASGGGNQPAADANHHYITSASPVYATGSDGGWQVAPAFNNTGRNVGAVVYGFINGGSGSNNFRFPCPNGTLDLAIALNHGSVANQRCGVVVIDGLVGGAPGYMTRSAAVSLNTQAIADDGSAIYKCTKAGTTGAVAPSFNGAATVVDGDPTTGVTWTFLYKILHIFDSGASPTIPFASVFDVLGQIKTETQYTAAQATKQIVVSQNGISVCKHPLMPFNIRSVGLRLISQPLSDATLTDAYGSPVVGSPSIHAANPAGKPLLKISSPVGAQNFSVDPSCDLYPYVQVQTLTALQTSSPGAWIVTNGVPIPDSFAGTPKTLTVIQTDPSAAITNSPHATPAFSVNIISSGGRVPQSGMIGMIHTGSWMVVKKVEDFKATRWVGYQGQAIDPSRDFECTDKASFDATYSALNPPANNINWYRIRVRNGVYEGVSGFAEKNFGTGGVLIEPYPGDDPEWNISFQSNVRGLHIRNMRMPLWVSKAGSYSGIILSDPGFGAGKFYSRLKVENCRIGTMFGTGADETKIATPAYTDGGGSKFIFSYIAEQVEVVGCTFDGAGVAVSTTGTRLLIVEDNEQKRATGDFVAHAPMNAHYQTSNFNAFGDNIQYISIRRNVVHHELDFATFSTGVHLDFRQIRLLQGSNTRRDNKPRVDANPNATPPTSDVPWVVGDVIRLRGHIYTVSAVTTGYTGSTPPTPTGGTAGAGQVDGGVTWDHTMALPPLVIYEVCAENTGHSHILQAGGCVRQFYFQNEDDTLFTFEAAVFDNCISTNAKNFITPAHPGHVWAEYNVGVAPSQFVGVGAEAVLGSTSINPFGLDPKIFAQNNIAGLPVVNVTGSIVGFNNAVADFAQQSGTTYPGNVMQGSFNWNSSKSRVEWPSMVDLTTTPKDQVVLQARKTLRPKAGVGAGCSLTIPFTVGPGPGRVGASLSTSVTIVPG